MLLSPNGGFNWGLVVGPLLLLALVIVFNGVHQIPEGHVGLYWTGGALQDTISPPGWAVKVPYYPPPFSLLAWRLPLTDPVFLQLPLVSQVVNMQVYVTDQGCRTLNDSR